MKLRTTAHKNPTKRKCWESHDNKKKKKTAKWIREQTKLQDIFKTILKWSCAGHIMRTNGNRQRWSPRGRPWPRGRPRGRPRGQILKSLALALASKVKSMALASRPQVLENWPVLGSRTALFFGKLKFSGAVEKFFGKRFVVEIA